MTKLGELNPNTFFCRCQQTTKDTPHTCVDSRLSKVNHIPLAVVMLVVFVAVAGVLWAGSY